MTQTESRQPANAELLKRLADVRDAVCRQLAERDQSFPAFRVTSEPWRTVTRMQQYVRELSPENLLDIRVHTDPFIGTLSANFWLTKSAAGFEDQYRYYGEGVPEAYWAYEPELPALAGMDYGYRINGRLLSDVATEYQRYLCNLYRLGIFEMLGQSARRPVVLEIGAGHGGFAQLFAEASRFAHTYIIVDLPETLMFSSVFLNVHHPNKRIYTYAPGDDLASIATSYSQYDFMLIPDYQFSRLGGVGRLDLVMNHVSFPEMPTETLRTYLEFVKARLDGYLVSVNYRGVANANRPFVDEVLAHYLALSPTTADLAKALNSDYQIINDINCRPTLVGSSSTEWRRRLAGRKLHDVIGTTGQRYVCRFQDDACALSLSAGNARGGWRSRVRRLARRMPVVRRLF